MIDKIENYVAKHRLFSKHDTLLLAVSGGIDSMVMLDVLYKLNYQLVVAHCNFQLRATAANEDEQFVIKTAQTLQIPIHTIRFQTAEFAEQHQLSIQMAARQLRYDWFYELCQKHQYTSICVAHHLHDQTETVLLNMTKGTGLKGLCGMSPRNQKVVRPFLGISKNEIISYATAASINYREDASNATTDYQRNLIRHNVLPHLEKLNPALHRTMEQNILHWKDSWELHQFALQKLTKKLVENRKGNYFISIKKIKSYPAPHTLLDAILSTFHFSHKQVAEVLKIWDSQEAKQIFNQQFRLLVSRNFIIIIPVFDAAALGNDFMMIADEHQRINTNLFTLKMEKVKFKGLQNKSHSWFLQLDFFKIQFPLMLRKWKRGDYFYPLGFNKKKKISDFLTDKKCSLLEKENTFVLLSEEKIIAVLGHETDHRFSITDSTKYCLEIVYKVK